VGKPRELNRFSGNVVFKGIAAVMGLSFCFAQKGRLEEEVQARNHNVIFYPKFHCGLNFIERFWSAAKYFARENCQYSLEKLRKDDFSYFGLCFFCIYKSVLLPLFANHVCLS